MFFKGPFWGAYFLGDLCTEGNLRLKIDWTSLIAESKFTFFALCIRGRFSNYKPRGAYIWRDDLAEGFLRYGFGGLIFGGAYPWRGLFSEFYGMSAWGLKVENIFISQLRLHTLISDRFVVNEMVSADLSPPFVCRKITPEISITLGVAAFPATFPCKTWRTVYKRNKKLARRFDGRVTLLAGPTILPINTLTRPAEATRSIPRPPALYLKEAIPVCVSAIVSSWLGQRGE